MPSSPSIIKELQGLVAREPQVDKPKDTASELLPSYCMAASRYQ